MSKLQRHFQTNLALGSETTLMLVCEATPDQTDMVFARLWRSIYDFERKFSRFLPQSELSIFNRKAGLKQPISAEFRDMLVVAKQLSQETDGLFNPFVLPALQRAGYTKSFAEGYTADTHDDYTTRNVVAASQLEIGDTWASIPFGAAIDLGGCGKGYLADQLADNLVPEWVDGYWFSMGGDIVGAGIDETNEPWSVAIHSAFEPKEDSPWQVQTSGGRFAVATSGTQVRKGNNNGKGWHHIIDPRTSEPAVSDLSVATVYTPSAVRADVLASCAIILGSEAATPFLHKLDAKSALLQGSDGQGKRIETTFGPAMQKKSARTSGRVSSHA
jgi:thiamine biosynthesis lipoprotein